MSPYENERDLAGSTLRSKYAFIFNTVVEIYKFYHIKAKVSSQFEKVKELTETLYKEERLSDYLYESLKVLFKLYPTLIPVELAKMYKNDVKNTLKKLEEIDELLLIAIGDLSQELSDIIKEDKDAYLRSMYDRY